MTYQVGRIFITKQGIVQGPFVVFGGSVLGLRGVRGKIRQAKADPVSTIAFNLIPEARSYECP